MQDRLGWMPLGQMNTVPGTAPRVAAPAATPETPAATVAGPAGGGNAVTSAPGTAPPLEQGAKSPSGIVSQLMGLAPIILMFIVLYFILFRGQRKEEKRRKSLIAELKKGDRVMTIGGLVARVVSIDGDEVVLKIDESANVKATYRKSSIQEVLVGDEKSK
jgi:preprotein translocase subunit YajC